MSLSVEFRELAGDCGGDEGGAVFLKSHDRFVDRSTDSIDAFHLSRQILNKQALLIGWRKCESIPSQLLSG